MKKFGSIFQAGAEDYTGVALIDGDKFHFLEGAIHNENGPAIIRSDQYGISIKEWYLYGEKHRLDGPAYIKSDKTGNVINEGYYVGDVLCKDKREFAKAVEKYRNLIKRKEECKNKGDITFTCDYSEKHTLDLPETGVIFFEGNLHWEKCYVKDGKNHNENGPAFVDWESEEWIINGKNHRLDGPAIIKYHLTSDDEEFYYIEGKQINKNLFKAEVAKYLKKHPEEAKKMTTLNKTVKGGTMNKVIDNVKSDSKNALYRQSSKQFLYTVKEPLVAAILKNANINNDMAKMAVAAFLETPVGEGVLSYVLGMLLPYAGNLVPKNALNGNPSAIIGRLGEELRVHGIDRAVMEPAAKLLVGPLRELLVNSIKDYGQVVQTIESGENTEPVNFTVKETVKVKA